MARLLGVKNLKDRFIQCAHPTVTAISEKTFRCIQCNKLLDAITVDRIQAKIINWDVSKQLDKASLSASDPR